MHRPVDVVLLAGAGVVAGGLALVAPWEVGAVAAVVLGLARAGRRVGVGAAAVVVVAGAVGLLRASRAVARHEAARDESTAALGLPKRCTAHARVIASPVRARDSLRWDARLDVTECDGEPVRWHGDATLYGG